MSAEMTAGLGEPCRVKEREMGGSLKNPEDHSIKQGEVSTTKQETRHHR